jgi:hypothetical protein
LPDVVVGNSLIATLEKQLGSLWTSEVRAAWIETVGVVLATMKEGAAAAVPSPLAAPETATQAVQRTWETVEQQGLEANGVILFQG